MRTKTAVVKIMIPLAYLDEKYTYQDIPLHSLDGRMVYIKKGASGYKSISSKNVKLLKVFNSDDEKGIEKYLGELRGENLNENISIGKIISRCLGELLRENIDENPIEFIFKNNTELANIGNMEQYSKYLNTIFPNSKVKGVYYHASRSKFSQFNDPSGSGLSHIWFSEEPLIGVYGNEIYSVLLDIKNPLSEFEQSNDYHKELKAYENPTNPDWGNNYHITGELPKFKYDATIRVSTVDNGKSITVRSPKQIHILGDEQDIEGFKKYVGVNNINENQKKGKLFIPRRISGEGSRWSDWNNSQPIIDGKRINQYDSEGNKTGYWESYHFIGDGNRVRVLNKGDYLDGYRVGVWDEYYDNGQLRSSINYVGGKKDGVWEIYRQNGEIIFRGRN
jgi:antitoxin component YwqK of YwqJK toxin-antitoxin module